MGITKDNMKNPKNGHKSRVKLEVRARWKAGEEKEQTFELDYEVTVTAEQIEYAVRKIASTVARVASSIAEEKPGRNGAHNKSTGGRRSVKPKAAPAASAPVS